MLTPAVSHHLRPVTTGVRVLTVAQAVVVACYLVGLSMFLRAYLNAGDLAGLRGGAYDPKDLVPFGMHLYNPFAWIYGAVSLSVLIGWLYSAVLAMVSVAALGFTRRYVSARAWWSLLVITIAGIAMVAVAFSPFGVQVGTWMAD